MLAEHFHRKPLLALFIVFFDHICIISGIKSPTKQPQSSKYFEQRYELKVYRNGYNGLSIKCFISRRKHFFRWQRLNKVSREDESGTRTMRLIRNERQKLLTPKLFFIQFRWPSSSHAWLLTSLVFAVLPFEKFFFFHFVQHEMDGKSRKRRKCALSFDVKRFFTFILQVIPRQMLCKNVGEILKEFFFLLAPHWKAEKVGRDLKVTFE